MTISKEIAEYVIDVYTNRGVEINSIGDTSIVVNLPPAFTDLTEFCLALYEEFGSIVDISYDNLSLQAKIWTTSSNKTIESSNSNGTTQQTEQSLWPVCRLLMFILFIVSLISSIMFLEPDHRSGMSDWLLRASLYLK